MRIAVVTNHRSGKGTERDRILRLLSRRGIRLTVLELADLENPLPEADRLVVAGGDGSLGAAARAAHTAGVPMAVVPTGTANDFAAAAGLPRGLEAACELAASATAATRHHELGLAGGHPYVNAAAAGLSAVASRLAAPHKKRLGALAYPVSAIRAGVSAPPVTCRVRVDDKECFSGKAWQVVVAVTGAFGGGSSLGGTRRDDGLLDVAAVPAGSRLALARYGWGMRRGTLTSLAEVRHHRGRHITVETTSEFNVDGELRQLDPADFTLLPGGFEVVVP